MLTELILNSYTNAQVKVVTLNSAANSIEIKCRAKPGDLLSPILLDFGIDPSIEKLSWETLNRMDIVGKRMRG
jgi:hypothetical protein